MECKEHPNYQAIRRPKSTEKHPEGCPECWKMYNEKNGTVTTSAVVPKRTTSSVAVTASPVPASPVVASATVVSAHTGRMIPKPVPKAFIADIKDKKSEVITKPVATDPQVREAISEKLIDDAVAKAEPIISKLVEDKIKLIFEDLISKKIEEAKSKIQYMNTVEYEHLFMDDTLMLDALLPRLEAEGWKFEHHSYPLGAKGIIKSDYYLFTRIKKKDNAPIPNFKDEKTLKKYMRTKNE